MNDKVVFLAHRNEKMETEISEHLTCPRCKNRTYIGTYTSSSKFPSLTCAVCGSMAGYFGWVDEENV